MGRTWHICLLSALTLCLWAGGARCAVFTDGMGREVTLDRTPRRIVALAPSITEILYFLGLGERVVGVTQFSSYPPEAADKPKVGSYVNLNPERIIGLFPDLVIGTADGNPPAVVELLERTGVPVFILNPRNIRQVIQALVTIGELCGMRDRAVILAAGLSRRVDAIVAKTAGLARPIVFLQVNLKPIMAANGTTFLNDLIRLAGGVNMTRDEPVTYPRISLEAVIRGRPEVILISSMDRNGAFEEAKRQWLHWTLIPAVKNGRVHLIDSDLTDRPSPRIVRGLEILARYIQPDAGWSCRVPLSTDIGDRCGAGMAKTASQSLSKILLPVVFSTKNRKPRIFESLQPQLYAYLAGACRTMGSDAIRVGGTDNHVHRCHAPSGLIFSPPLSPGRCPGLVCHALSGLGTEIRCRGSRKNSGDLSDYIDYRSCP